MAPPESDYYDYLHGGLLHDRYLRVKSLNEGSFGIVSIAKDMKDNEKLVAVKYNTGRLTDFEAFQTQSQSAKNLDVKSVSLNSKTRSVLASNSTYSHTQNSEGDVSKSIVLRETKQEIIMLKKVDKHPNITTLLDSFDTFMVLEYAPRGDLHDAIQLGIAPVATRDVIDVFMQLISAVEFCHKNGVYHRDIKPENILIAEDWSIKLTDFGLATDRLICNDFDVGSERYMAPELLEHSDIDSYAADKVDIWSLGICLLNIVFGKSPFRSASSKDKMFLHFAANRETLFDIFPFMSYDLFSVMIHSLTLDPANRDLEMIKQNLLTTDVLTYDYEFEEEVEDIKGNVLVEAHNEDEESHIEEIAQSENSKLIANNEASANTEQIAAVEKQNQIQTQGEKEDHEEKENIENIEKQKIPESKEMKENNLTVKQLTLDSPTDVKATAQDVTLSVSQSPKSTSDSDNEESDSYKRLSVFPAQTTPKISISPVVEMDSIDSVIEGTDSNIETHTATQPIPIQKKYEPPHKLLSSNSLFKYMTEFKKSTKKGNNGSYNNINNNHIYNNSNNNNNNNNNYRARRWNPAHRKPLRIANYNYRNRSQDGRFSGRGSFKEEPFDFNRKDFFTPKSMFSHYMEKANKNKQQLQQRGTYYKKFKDFDNSNNLHYSNKHFNNNNSSYNSSYYSNHGNRRAWQKRKRRSSHAPINNGTKNKGSYRMNNNKSRNISDNNNRSLNSDANSQKQRKLSSNITNLVRLSSSLRSSIDGKYVPPNMRLTASQLMGSAIVSDDEYEPEVKNTLKGYNNTTVSNRSEHTKLHNSNGDENNALYDSGDSDDSEEGGFSFEFEQPEFSNKRRDNIAMRDNRNMFQQIQSNAINLMSKQVGEMRLFDEKNNCSRDTSLTTTVSNNVCSIGSNMNNSPKGYKKYVPPHHRRSSHSGEDSIAKHNFSSNVHSNHFGEHMNSKFLPSISSSAPTKSSSFFNVTSKLVQPHELLHDDYNNFDDTSDDLFDIEEN